MAQAINLYRGISEMEEATGNFKAALRYVDTMRLVEDSLARKISMAKVKNIEKEIAKAQLLSTEENLRYQKNAAKQTRNMLIVIIISSSIIIILLINIFRNRKERLEAEKNKANYELKASHDKLATFTHNIQEKNKLLENLEKKLTNYENSKQTAEYASAISELRDATILTDDDWADFKKNFEKANPGYMSVLKEEYPDLTQAEIRYVVLSRLDMSTKEIASVLGVTAGSVRTTKSRLMRKTGFENEDVLKDIINAL